MTKVLFISILASLGAAAVAWGLFLECFGEKTEYRDIEDFRSSKQKSHRGQKWVFWGVIAEMILGFGIAIWDGAEMAKTDRQIKAADPRNQPLKSATAVATIFFSSSVLVSNKLVDAIIQNKGEHLLHMTLLSKTGYLIDLYSDVPPPPPMEYPGKNGLPISNSVSIHLSGDAPMRQPFDRHWNSLVIKTNLTAGQIADSDFDVSLEPSFLRAGTVVLGGSVEVWFNSPTVERDFSIQPQGISDWEFEFLKCVPATNVGQIPQQ